MLLIFFLFLKHTEGPAGWSYYTQKKLGKLESRKEQRKMKQNWITSFYSTQLTRDWSTVPLEAGKGIEGGGCGSSASEAVPAVWGGTGVLASGPKGIVGQLES